MWYFLRQPATKAKSLGHAYVGIVESLVGEMTLADVEHMKIRRGALWLIFQDSFALRRLMVK